MQSIGVKPADWHSEYTKAKGFDEQILGLLKYFDRLILVGGDGTMSAAIQCVISSEPAKKRAWINTPWNR